MRHSFLVVLFILTGALLYAGNGGVKERRPLITYQQHDRFNGLRKLETSAGHSLQVNWNEMYSTPAFVTGRLTKPGYASSADRSEDGIRFLTENRDLFGISDPAKELTAAGVNTDNHGMTHVKYSQYINGIRLYYSDLIVHFNHDGSIESVNGAYVPTPIVNTSAKISKEAAEMSALRQINYKPDTQSSELVIYHKDNQPVLAYMVKLPGRFTPAMTVIVNAEDGSIIRRDDGIRYDGPAKGKGTGLDGKLVNIDTYLYSGTYYMINAALPMYVPPFDSMKGLIMTYDCLNDTADNGFNKAALITDPNGDNNFSDNERLKAGVTAHLNSKTVYEFYKSHFNRNSFDNKGTRLINAVHYKDKYNNAFWNGAAMAYGDGDGQVFSNLVGALDVTCHEMTHGVIDNSAGLIYQEQSGAINESMADVFGTLIDSTDWLMGEDVYTPSIPGDGLRNISDPSNGRPADDILNGWQPQHMSEFRVYPNDEDHDWGGVHVNSGILNKAFYNAAIKLGHWKAGQIWYRSLTVYLTKSSKFTDCRLACLNSAKDLYGLNSAEYNTVKDAFSAVGLGDPPVSVTTDLVYDDGSPETTVYEEYPMWQLGVRFSPPVKNYSVTNIQVYINGDYYKNGTGQYKLGMYKADPATGLPGITWMAPGNQIPGAPGWQKYDIYGGGTYDYDFYVTVLYDGAGYPLIGADMPPGNGRAYEYDLTKRAWVKLASPYDYTLFMRATVKTTTAVTEVETKVPGDFRLEQNYPNPFNPNTTIKYSLPTETAVKVIVYDVNGIQTAELVNNNLQAGSYTVSWNGMNDNGQKAASGIYYCRIQAGKFDKTIKMSLMK